jgi:hypothetical protein
VTLADDRVLETLSRDECDRLLAAGEVGRVITTEGALPIVVPVNYACHGSHIFFRTEPGSKLAAARRGTVVAFEVDRFDLESRTGWSVSATGVAEEVTEPGEILRADQLGIRTWVPGCHRYVRITVGLVTGRRVSRVRPPVAIADQAAP